MGPCSLLVGVTLSLFAPEPETVVHPMLPPVSDGVDRPRLAPPNLSFTRTSTLRILGKGRFGTWSLYGSTIGAALGAGACLDPRGLACAPMSLAELGLAWRPFGSRVSLFAGVGIASLSALRQSLGIQIVGGLRIDLGRWIGVASRLRR